MCASTCLAHIHPKNQYFLQFSVKIKVCASSENTINSLNLTGSRPQPVRSEIFKGIPRKSSVCFETQEIQDFKTSNAPAQKTRQIL